MVKSYLEYFFLGVFFLIDNIENVNETQITGNQNQEVTKSRKLEKIG